MGPDPKQGDPVRTPPQRLVEPATDLDMRPGWRLGDAQLEADAIDYWRRLGNLPADTPPETRAKELVAGCYRDGSLIGVLSARAVPLELLRARFFMLRSSVAPEARRGHAAATMAYYARDHLERWAADHPAEKMAGIAAILESRELAGLGRVPFWPGTGLRLAGYTPDGRQIRISWFRHYRLD
ncbi:MAG: hypothetical protein QOH81_226 [Sphingomonadales bacterium]|jgi:hypothetical protein|nr:hypothetical protein [Sphingomonadales bacterium]